MRRRPPAARPPVRLCLRADRGAEVADNQQSDREGDDNHGGRQYGAPVIVGMRRCVLSVPMPGECARVAASPGLAVLTRATGTELRVVVQ